MIDSGFRRGTDILKAVGLGAQFVFIGRPFNYAAALAGEPVADDEPVAPVSLRKFDQI